MVDEATTPEEETTPQQDPEVKRVLVRRAREARRAGMTRLEANLFAESDIDISELRHLVELHCPPRLLAGVLL